MRPLILLLLTVPVFAQRPRWPDFDIRGADRPPLPTPARDFLTTQANSLRLDRRVADRGAATLHYVQTHNGVPVFHGDVKVAVDAAGQVVHTAYGDVIANLNLDTTPRLTAEEAVRAAFGFAGVTGPTALEALATGNRFRNPFGESLTPLSADLAIFPMQPSPRLAWRILLELDAARWYELLVDAENGALLFRYNIVRRASGRVYRESPLKGGRELIAFPDEWLRASIVTTGNNADAYLDADGDNAPDTLSTSGLQSGRAFSATQVFDFPTGAGSTGLDPRAFQAAAVTNVFYFTNLAHDYYYALGFNEAAGNFQTNNFGRGGLGHDAIRAEVQDSGVPDNATFATPPDGTAPRMQVGITSLGTTLRTDDLDSAYDGMTVIHEVGHGVTGRMVGGVNAASCLRGLQSGAMGEGWSDYFAISFYNNPVFDAYDAQDTVRGIRRFSFEGYPFTYEDIGNSRYEVHNDGEIWTAALWDLRKSLGANVTDRLVVGALKTTTCGASMLTARDAILAADQTTNSNANRVAIWTVFARHGMGFSASGIDGAIYNAAFDRPPDLQPGNRNPVVASAPPAGAQGVPYTYSIAASDPDGSPLRYELNQGGPGMTIDATTGRLQWTPGFLSQRVKVSITDGAGGRILHGFRLRVETPLTVGQPMTIAAAQGTTGVTTVDVPAGTQILQVTLRGGTGDADMY
ncbi:MAG: M36 family metallopeptidase, partial [Bryobacteraceae bacterium]